MYGMGQPKRKKMADWKFDLENDFKNDPKVRKETNERLDSGINKLKTKLREGGDKKSFDDAQILLHGFLAAQKVIQRAIR